MDMKRLIMTLLAALGIAAAEYNVGDRIPIVLDHFGGTFDRDTVIDTATVLFKGSSCYVATCYVNRYVNKATGLIDSLTKDTTLTDSIANVVFQDFQNGGQTALLGNWGLSASDLYDADGDSRFFIFIAPTYVGGTDKYNSDPGLYPFFGYFDKFNEDTTDTTGLSNKKDMIVLSTNLSAYPDYAALAAYLYSRYIAWSLDDDEELVSITGLAMYNAFKAGYDVVGGFSSGRSFGGAPIPTNRSLYSYTLYYTNSPVAREQDRERMLLWFIWLEENLNNGEAFIEEVAKNSDRLARNQIAERLQGDLGLSLRFAFAQFAMTCALNHRHLSGYTFTSLPDDTLFSFTRGMSAPVNDQAYTLTIMPLRKSGASSVDIYFKGQERNKLFVDGDSISGFMIFMYDTVTGILTDYSDQLDSLNRIWWESLSGRHYIYLLNINDAAYYYRIGPNTNIPDPRIIGLYSIQNPAFLKVADVYLASEDQLYSDAAPGDTTPKIIVEASQSGYTPLIYTLATVLDEDDNGVGGDTMARLYNGTMSLELKDQFGNIYSGDVYVKLYRAMNKLGVDVTNPMEDTIGLVHIYGAGVYSLLGGNVVLEIPDGALANGTTLMVDRADASLCLADGSEGTAFNIGARSIPVNKPVTLRLATDGPVSLYYYNGSRWEMVESYLNPENSVLVAHVSAMGTYLLGRPGTPSADGFTLWAPTAMKLGGASLYLSLPADARITWDVYDVAGKRVAQPYDGNLGAGNRVLSWNTAETSAGIYFYRILVDGQTHLMKVALVGR